MTKLEKRLYCDHPDSIVLTSFSGKEHHFNYNQMKYKGGHHKAEFGITSPGCNNLTHEETRHFLTTLKNAAKDTDNIVWFEQYDATYFAGAECSVPANFMYEKRERRVTIFLQTPQSSHGVSSFVLYDAVPDPEGILSVKDLYYNHNSVAHGRVSNKKSLTNVHFLKKCCLCLKNQIHL